MVRSYVKNKDLGIKRAASSFLLFSQKVLRDGCEATPQRRLRDKTYVKEERVTRWRKMPESERQQFREQMSEGHKETKEKRSLLLQEVENISRLTRKDILHVYLIQTTKTQLLLRSPPVSMILVWRLVCSWERGKSLALWDQDLTARLSK